MFKNVSPSEDLPSPSQSTPNRSDEGSQMAMQTDTGRNSGMLMSPCTIDFQEQRTRSFVDGISRSAQELIERTNNRRSSDLKELDRVQEMLVAKVTEICQQMREHMYTVYEKNSNEMQMKLQELSVVLESCTKHSSELVEASQELTGVKEDLDISVASES